MSVTRTHTRATTLTLVDTQLTDPTAMPRPFTASFTAWRLPAALACLAFTAGCTVVYHRNDDPSMLPEGRVHPGITVLLRDSIGLISD